MGPFLLGWPLGTPTMAGICDKRAEITGLLKRRYEEAPVALGVTNGGGLVELLTSENGETWTLIITYPNGLTCLMAAGENWESIVAKFGEDS